MPPKLLTKNQVSPWSQKILKGENMKTPQRNIWNLSIVLVPTYLYHYSLCVYIYIYIYHIGEGNQIYLGTKYTSHWYISRWRCVAAAPGGNSAKSIAAGHQVRTMVSTPRFGRRCLKYIALIRSYGSRKPLSCRYGCLYAPRNSSGW